MRTRSARGRPAPQRLLRRTLGRVLTACFGLALTVLGLTGTAQPASAAGTLISGSKPVVASSIESANFPAGAAVDGDPTSRWASAWSDPQWLQIDLGAGAQVSSIEIDWEAAYASGYQVQASNDASTWTTVHTVTNGTGGTESYPLSVTTRYLRLYLTQRATGYGYSLYEWKVFGTPSTSGTTGYVLADPQVTGQTPATGNPPHAYFHEFQANCSADHELPDDPIVFPGQPGASHMHTFMGNTTTNANSTLASLNASTSTTCLAPGDKSGYWMPTVYNGNTPIIPSGVQTIYYKSGINDYTAVRPFPAGLRFLVGSPSATATEFANAPGYVAGWECGNSYHNIDIPISCDPGSNLEIRMQAPSCWNGLYLDTPDHKSHMAYPVNGVCPADHPIALPMIEFKMAFPVSGDMSQVHLSSGRGFSFHYDFFNAWDPATLNAMVTHCINGGLQCDARGYDQSQPDKGAALNQNYELP
jgi:hypothetical protein